MNDFLIKNTGKISLQELYELKQKGIRQIKIEDKSINEIYDIDTFILIKKKLLEYIQNIPNISDDDPNKEKKIFTYLYIKIAQNIIYDEEATEFAGYVGYARDMTENRVSEANNLIGGLLNGMSICKGYSEILRNLLSEVGINAIVICGGSKTMREGTESHAWNQVYLDGKWHNCDITNDVDFIKAGLKLPHFLKSNKDFGKDDKHRYTKYSPKNPEIVQLADTTISDEQQEELIEEQRKNIMNEISIDENSNEKKYIKTTGITVMNRL